MYEDKLHVMGLERELENMTDEEVERELIELHRTDYNRIAAKSASAADPPKALS
jgi:hypothetical protein